MSTGDTTITAHWKKRSSSSGGSSPSYYFITFDTNGGEAMEKLMKLEHTEIDLENYIPEREGYTFEGWYLDHDFDQAVDSVTLRNDISNFISKALVSYTFISYDEETVNVWHVTKVVSSVMFEVSL